MAPNLARPAPRVRRALIRQDTVDKGIREVDGDRKQRLIQRHLRHEQQRPLGQAAPEAEAREWSL